MLGAFRRRPRPAVLSILSSLDSARCVARRRFSLLQPEIPPRAARHLFRMSDLTGYARCVRLPFRCTRTPVRWRFCAARHRPLAAFQPHFLVLSVESAARRWLCRVWHRRNTPDTWQKRKLMAADCLVSLDAFLSRLLSGPDSRAICSCVSICLRVEGTSRRPACVRIHQGTATDRYVMVAHGVCAVCASLGSSCVHVRAGFSQGFPVI